MLWGHFKSTLVCTAPGEYVMGKENEKCGDAEIRKRLGVEESSTVHDGIQLNP